MIGRQLSPEHQDQTMIVCAGKSAARRRQRSGGGPFVSRRIVDVMLAGAVGRTFEASTDRVNFSVDRDDDQMIARHRQRRRFGPSARFRIEDLVCADHSAVRAAPADHVDSAFYGRRTGGPAGYLHGWKDAPRVSDWIVRKRLVAGILMDRSSKSAEGIDCSVGPRHCQVISSFRKRRPRPPGIGAWIIFIVVRRGSAI